MILGSVLAVLMLLVAAVAINGLSEDHNGVGMLTRPVSWRILRDRFVGIVRGERARTRACVRAR